MKVHTKSRHRTKVGGNVFLGLGFAPKEAKRLLAHADAQIDESMRLKQHLMDEIAEWMKGSQRYSSGGSRGAPRYAASRLRRRESQSCEIHDRCACQHANAHR